MAFTGIGLPATIPTGGTGGVSQDHIFESTAARDTYFTSSDARLAELITGTPIVVTISGTPRFQSWGAATPAQISDYAATNWATEDAIDGTRILTLLNALTAVSVQTQAQSDTTNSVSGLTVGRLPIATATGLENSPARMSGERVFIPELEVESGTVRVGDVIGLSEATGFVALNNQLDGNQFTILDFLTPPNAASSRPRRLALTEGQRRVNLQANVGQMLTQPEIQADYITQELGRTNELILFSDTPITNLRVRIENVTPGNPQPVKYIPSRRAWEDGTGGLDFTPGGELALPITSSPMVFGPNRTLRIIVRKSSGTLLGFNNEPAASVEFQGGQFVESADLTDVPDNVGDLDDVPATRGTAGQILAINAAGTGLEYTTPAAPATQLTGAQILSLLNAMSGISVQTTDQSETTNSLANLSAGRFPIATASGLADSDLRILNTELFLPGRPYIEASGLDLGEVVRISESAGAVSYISSLDRIRRTLIGFRTPTNAASSRPRRLALTQAEQQLDVQANVSDPMTATELGGTYTINRQGRINAIQFFSQTAVFDVRVRITSGFDIVKYIPSREAWDSGENGLDFTPGGQLLIRLDDSPLFSAANQAFDIAIRKGSGTLLGSGGLPAFVIRIQDGTYTELADLSDVPDTIGELDDVPATRGTAGQVLAVNAAADGLEYITQTANQTLTNWNHAAFPAGQIPQATHTWYRHTGAANITRAMPTTANLPTGWHMFAANDTTDTTITLTGAFFGITQLVLREQEGCEISWDGTSFVEGPRRDRITTSNLAEWQHNPLIPGNTYTTRGGIAFTAGQSIFNQEANGVTADTLNRLVIVEAPGAYRIDIPTLAPENRSEIPVNEGFGFTNNGGGILSITPRSVDEIAMGGTRYRGQSPMRLAFGASVTFTRTNDDLYTVTSSRGTITGGV